MRLRSVWFCFASAVLSSSVSPARAHELVDFGKEVDPIINRNCGGTTCHINQTTSGVNLSSHQQILDSRGDQYMGPVVIPGDPDGSPLMDKISNATPRFGEH